MAKNNSKKKGKLLRKPESKPIEKNVKQLYNSLRRDKRGRLTGLTRSTGEAISITEFEKNYYPLIIGGIDFEFIYQNEEFEKDLYQSQEKIFVWNYNKVLKEGKKFYINDVPVSWSEMYKALRESTTKQIEEAKEKNTSPKPEFKFIYYEATEEYNLIE